MRYAHATRTPIGTGHLRRLAIAHKVICDSSKKELSVMTSPPQSTL
ncbi:MAG: hypothetical protein GDA38_04430 [Hormoscilla sp. SP12CHS1]|nr:hypothetical protein [Hormoscilla sp. SP12CHS1]